MFAFVVFVLVFQY